MAVIEVKRQHDQTRRSSSLRDDGQRQITETWEYLVRTTQIETDVDAIESASYGGTSIPDEGDTHPINSDLICTAKSVERIDKTGLLWRVEVSWTSDTQAEAEEVWNVEMSVTGTEFQQQAYQDKDGNPIVNSAGQPFEPGLTESFYDEEITVSFNSYSVNASGIEAARGKVNDQQITLTVNGVARTYEARHLKCVQAGYQTVYSGGNSYWRITYVFRSRVDGYTETVLDQGFAELVAGELVTIKDANGEPLNAQSMLDGAGAVSTDGPHWLSFAIDEEASLATLLTDFGG